MADMVLSVFFRTGGGMFWMEWTERPQPAYHSRAFGPSSRSAANQRVNRQALHAAA